MPTLPKNPKSRNKWRRLITGKKQPNWERGEIDPLGKCRLLDFGCGAGQFLQRMHNRGWQVAGLDLSAKVVKYVLEELRLPAFVGTLPNPVLPPGSFDLVTLWHSLEHMHRPLETLCEVHNLLAPGGKALVAVPNIDSTPFHWFGSAWYGLDLPRHLTHFTPATLRKMLDRAGFQFEAMQMVRHSYWLRQSAQLASSRGTISPPLSLLKFRLPSSIVSKWHLLAGKSDSFVIMARKAAAK
jgi:2-polyprenyl-3-methyl-5-hydroxy-6-metoxy-1,4-benzoquinol methylase